MIKKNTKVLVRKWKSDPGKGLSYAPFFGTLLEDCNGSGWDVIDIKRITGKTQSVYSFCVERSKNEK